MYVLLEILVISVPSFLSYHKLKSLGRKTLGITGAVFTCQLISQLIYRNITSHDVYNIIHRVKSCHRAWSRYDRHFVGITWHNVRN